MLGILKEITFRDRHWDWVEAIVDALKAGTAEVISKEWTDQFRAKWNDPLDITTIKTWSTQEEMVKLEFMLEGERLVCDADVREPYGDKSAPRFKARIALPMAFIDKLETSLAHKFAYMLDNEYEDFLDEERRKWKEARGRELLGGDYKLKG